MAMKPETKFYVLLGKILVAIKKSLTLRDCVVDFEGEPESEILVIRIRINGRELFFNLELADAEKITEQELLDDFMSLYNVQL